MTDERISAQQLDTQETQAPQGPPIPKFMFHVVNPLMKVLLRSPLHRLVSNELMLLTFRGRKSGRRYTIPVGYIQRGDRLYIFSHTPWWKNLRGGAPVAVRLCGKNRRGTSEVMRDPKAIAQVVQAVVEKRGEAMARRMGLITEGQRPEDAPPPAHTIFIEIKLEHAGA